jgi:selenide, water dikinase
LYRTDFSERKFPEMKSASQHASTNLSIARATSAALPSAQEPPRLTSLSPAGGCGCKIDPVRLSALLATLKPPPIAGEFGATWDDAAIFLPQEEKALVYTIDFFTPLVDDAAAWGAIAAAHACSDIYAMGGRPLLALSVASWTRNDSLDQLAIALRAAQEKLSEAGAALVGGHTIWDQSPKLGFTVIGSVDERSILRKSGGGDGDALVLTKPLGTGVVSTALKRSAAKESTVRAAVEVMSSLNASAAAAAVELGLSCATDVTGFGLAGHLRDVAAASGLGAVLQLEAVPVIEGALELANAHHTGNAAPNRHYADPHFAAGSDPRGPLAELLFDPQSSGGLLIACPSDRLEALRTRLRETGSAAAVIGHLTATQPVGRITVEP